MSTKKIKHNVYILGRIWIYNVWKYIKIWFW